MSELFENRLAALRQRFRDRASAESRALEIIVLELEAGMPGGTRQAEIKRIAHSLAGAGGTFGFSAISACAAELEEFVSDLPNSPSSPALVAPSSWKSIARYGEARGSSMTGSGTSAARLRGDTAEPSWPPHEQGDRKVVGVFDAPESFASLATALANVGYDAVACPPGSPGRLELPAVAPPRSSPTASTIR